MCVIINILRVMVITMNILFQKWEYIITVYSQLFNKSIDEIKKGEPYFYSIEDTGISLASYFKMLNPSCIAGINFGWS